MEPVNKPAAIFFFADIPKEVDRQKYYDLCKGRIIKDGMIPINPIFYSDHISYIGWEYLKQVLPCLNAIYLFEDFGTDTIMNDMEYYFSGPFIKIVKTKFSRAMIWHLQNTMEKILLMAAENASIYFNKKITKDQVKSKSRKRELVMTRQFFCKRVKDVITNERHSLAKIGAVVSIDHATVLHGINTIETTVGLIEEYNKFWNPLKVIKKETPINFNESVELEESIKAEMKLRAKEFKPEHGNITQANNQPFSGYREHQL